VFNNDCPLFGLPILAYCVAPVSFNEPTWQSIVLNSATGLNTVLLTPCATLCATLSIEDSSKSEELNRISAVQSAFFHLPCPEGGG
jgi:hypothetical protein